MVNMVGRSSAQPLLVRTCASGLHYRYFVHPLHTTPVAPMQLARSVDLLINCLHEGFEVVRGRRDQLLYCTAVS